MEKNVMNIAMVLSDNYSVHCATLINSILKNSLSGEEFNFYIIESDMSDKHKALLNTAEKIRPYNIHFCRIDGEFFNNPTFTIDIKKTPKVSVHTFYKYLILDMLKDIDRVLYLDLDMIVRGSLSDLYNTDLGENYIAASPDIGEPGLIAPLKTKLEVEEYYNAGVVLYDLKKCRENNMYSVLLENHLKLYEADKITYADQCVLNYTFKNKIKTVDKKYNAMFCLKKNPNYKYVYKNPVIVHYTTHRKPWDMHLEHKFAKDYFKYLNLEFEEARAIYSEYKKQFLKKFLKGLKTVFKFIASYFLFPWYVYKTYKLIQYRK